MTTWASSFLNYTKKNPNFFLTGTENPSDDDQRGTESQNSKFRKTNKNQILRDYDERKQSVDWWVTINSEKPFEHEERKFKNFLWKRQIF